MKFSFLFFIYCMISIVAMLSILYNVCHTSSISCHNIDNMSQYLSLNHLFNAAAVYDELLYMLHVMFSY